MGSSVVGSVNLTMSLMSEMIQLSRSLISQGKLGELVDTLVKYGERVIFEAENLERNHDLVKNECLLLRESNGRAEIQRMKFQEDLLKAQTECEDLKESLTRSIEDEKLSRERARRAEDKYAKVCGDQSKMMNEKNKIIMELNRQIPTLENQVLERDQMLGMYKEKLKFWGEKAAGKEEELKVFKGQSDQVIQELRRKHLELVGDLGRRNLEVSECKEKLKFLGEKVSEKEEEVKDLKGHTDQVIQELNRKRLEAVEELRRRNLEVSECKDRLKFWGEKVAQTEAEIKDLKGQTGQVIQELNRKRLEAVEELRSRNLEASESKEELKKLTRVVERDQLMFEEALTEMSRKYTQAIDELKHQNFEKSGVVEALRIQMDAVEKDRLMFKEALADMSEKHSQAVDELRRQYLEKSGVIEALKTQMGSLEAEFDEKLKRKQTEANKTIEELGCRYMKALFSVDQLRCLMFDADEVVDENKKHWKSLGNLPRIKVVEDGLVKVLKVKVEQLTNVVIRAATQVNSSPVSGDSVDEQSPESDVNRIIASIRNGKLQKAWMSGADMLNDFQNDVELCMNGVCVLYRHKILVLESGIGLNGELAHFEALRGSALAEYLIDGDPQNRLKKFVSEVRQQWPDILAQCRKIAMDYSDKLFFILHNGKDPCFKFKSSSFV